MAYSENTLDDIRARIDIVDLIGQFVQLKKSGQGFMGLCPFHKEKTGSFHIHPGKQVYKCFGCQKGGNIFTFLMQYEGVNFPEAVQRLAKKAGVELKEEKTFVKQAPEVNTSHERLYEALELAAKFYQYLLAEKKEYKTALDYITSRGITKKTIDTFRIGVSPTGWSGFLDVALKRGFTLQELITAGLVAEKEGGKAGYDRFRYRLMFPITNKEGRVIGFGARILDEQNDQQPKYINSIESPVFSKRKNLYGIYENSRGVRLKNEAVIVEGYMDVVGLYEAGVTNAVATMGTALTEEHLRELKNLSKNLVTVFDPDAAGIEAWHRSMHLCLEAGFFAKDLSLPDGKDPDEFAIAEGADSFYELCANAPRQITKYLKEIAKKGPLNPQESAKHLEALTPILVASKRLPDRALLWDDISMVLKVSPQSLKELAQQAAEKKGIASSETPMPSRSFSHTTQTKKAAAPNVLDHEFLFACVRWPEEFLKLPEEEWSHVVQEEGMEVWLQELRTASSIDEFEQKVEKLIHKQPDHRLSSTAMSALFEEKNATTKSGPTFAAVLERLRRRKKEFEIKALTAQVKLTQRMGDAEEQLRLLNKMKDLKST